MRKSLRFADYLLIYGVYYFFISPFFLLFVFNIVFPPVIKAYKLNLTMIDLCMILLTALSVLYRIVLILFVCPYVRPLLKPLI